MIANSIKNLLNLCIKIRFIDYFYFAIDLAVKSLIKKFYNFIALS